MTTADPKVDAYFARLGQWKAEILALRAILLDCPVQETFKWRSPCYTAAGGNVATLWAMKAFCGLSFFKGVLLRDEAGILIAPGDNSRSVRVARITSVEEVEMLAPLLKRYVLEAVENEKAGRTVTFEPDDLPYPAELVDRLARDPALAAAFDDLTPGRRRGYVLHFSQAKQPATRAARIDKHAARILQGKGMQDR